MTPRAALAAAGLAVLGLAGCTGGTSPPQRIFLITWDTTRADRLGCYGYEQPTSPNLDRFADEAVLFEQAVSPVPTTLPSHSTMFTGLYPQDHGVRYNIMYRLEDEAETLTEALRENGYRTAGFPAAFVLDRMYGLEQGFDHWVEPAARPYKRRVTGRPAAEGVDDVLAWLDQNVDDRIFVWLHFYDPHTPFTPPFPYSSQFSDRPYDGELAYTDAEFGRLMDVLRESPHWDRTLVVVAGDHGEGLQEHGESWHTFLLYETTQRVPFMVRAPGVRARRVSEPVALADISPTVLELAGIEPPADLRGVSLSGALRGETAPARFLYFETYAGALNYGWQEISGLRFSNWKLIDSSEPELYDLDRDPGELDNLADDEPERLERFRNELAQLAKPIREMTPEPLDQDLSPETVAAFAALGYVAGGTGGEVAADARTPQSQIHLEREISLARVALAARNWSYVEDLCRYIFEHDPKNKWALTNLTWALLELGRPDEADVISKELIETYPKNSNSYMTRGRALSVLGRAEEAYLLLEAGRKEVPENEHMGYLLLVAGFDAARPMCDGELDLLLEQFPESGRIRMLNARCALRGPSGVEGALQELEQAVHLGYQGLQSLRTIDEFDAVVAHEGFDELVEQLKRQRSADDPTTPADAEQE